MKNSSILVSLLFGAFAVAAPVDRRALVYHTEIVTETVVVYTTVYDDEPVAAPTTASEGMFYEQPKASTTSTVVEVVSSAAPSSAAPTSSAALTSAAPTSSAAPSSTAAPTSSAVPAYTPPAPVESSSVYTPPPQTPTPTPTPTPEAPKPTTTEPAYTPAPVSSAAPVVASSSLSNGGGSGEQYSDVDMTIYDNNGGYGACGTKLYDTDVVVALAQPAWGVSTYDTMTGKATNPWCGKKIKVQYEDNEIEATIMDLCPGCSGHDIDLSLNAWNKLTNGREKTRLKASWSVMA